MSKKRITILHPFTAEAVGLNEDNFLSFHSQPHFRAAKMLMAEGKVDISFEYFTSRRQGYIKQIEGINYRFYPVTRKWNGDHRKWKKQTSKGCLKRYKKNSPDITIINMSGHSSPFSFELSKAIRNNNSQYIAMLGGQHYSDNDRNRLYYKGADHLLVHTQMQKEDMQERELFRGTDIRIFPLGVDTSVFKPAKKSNSIPSLLYVGRIIPLKRIHLAILGVKYLKDKIHPESQLKIIGPSSSNEYLEKLRKTIKEFNLEDNIKFLGSKPHDALPKYFQEADLFVLPSAKETFGMVMIEAMACGTPVVGMDCAGGPSEVIVNGYNGILSTQEKFSLDILGYFESDQLARKLSLNALNTAVKEYNIINTFEALKGSIKNN